MVFIFYYFFHIQSSQKLDTQIYSSTALCVGSWTGYPVIVGSNVTHDASE